MHIAQKIFAASAENARKRVHLPRQYWYTGVAPTNRRTPEDPIESLPNLENRIPLRSARGSAAVETVACKLPYEGVQPSDSRPGREWLGLHGGGIHHHSRLQPRSTSEVEIRLRRGIEMTTIMYTAILMVLTGSILILALSWGAVAAAARERSEW